MTVYLSDYQTFNSKQELNHHVSQHEKEHQDVLNATDRNILRFIARYSVKYAGASHLKVATIAEAIEKTERTVGRVLNRLESLGIIRRIGMIRPKSGGKGASIIQILPYMSERMSDSDITENPMEPTDQPNDSGNEPLRKLLKPNTRTRDGEAGKRALKTGIPAAIYNAFEPFFNANELYDVYGILLRAKASIDRTITLEDNSEQYTGEFHNVIRKYKLGQVRNFKGLLYSAWQKVTSEITRRTVLAKSTLYYDWLNG